MHIRQIWLISASQNKLKVKISLPSRATNKSPKKNRQALGLNLPMMLEWRGQKISFIKLSRMPRRLRLLLRLNNQGRRTLSIKLSKIKRSQARWQRVYKVKDRKLLSVKWLKILLRKPPPPKQIQVRHRSKRGQRTLFTRWSEMLLSHHKSLQDMQCGPNQDPLKNMKQKMLKKKKHQCSKIKQRGKMCKRYSGKR